LKIDQTFDYGKHQREFGEIPSHNLDEQPPPPGDESELHDLQPPKMITGNDSQDKDGKVHSDGIGLNPNGPTHSSETENNKLDHSRSEHHHHHKRNRGKHYETSSDDKKTREKKKRKKSREHDKKKSKKERKTRPEKEKVKKFSSKTESVEKKSESENTTKNELVVQNISQQLTSVVSEELKKDKRVAENDSNTTSLKNETTSLVTKPFRRSDSILDINPNIDLEIDEWHQPEMSKWERDESKSAADILDPEIGSNEERAKKSSEEKVTSEIIKRAENAIFARAISAIRPLEIKGKLKSSDISLDVSKIEISPLTSASKKTEKDSKVSAFQVTIPANESSSRSVELKNIESSRDLNKSRKSPMRPSIKNRLGVKVVDKRSRSKSLSRSPKRRLQSDCTKVVRSTRDENVRSHAEKSAVPGRDRYPSSENRRSYKPLSFCVKIAPEKGSRDSNTNHHNRGRMNERKRSLSAEDKNNTQKRRKSRSRSHSRFNTRRSDQRSKVDSKSFGGKTKENSSRVDEKHSKAVEQSLNDGEKKVKGSRQIIDQAPKKQSRDSSTSSSSSSSSQNSQKHSKRHGKQKKKKSRSLSAESNGTLKRKKSKKEKKVKRKKKSSRK
jgi:E3 ubiquitin-protein ligase RBBP6